MNLKWFQQQKTLYQVQASNHVSCLYDVNRQKKHSKRGRKLAFKFAIAHVRLARPRRWNSSHCCINAIVVSCLRTWRSAEHTI